MSVNLEQAPGTGGKVTEPPLHPCKPKDASSATAVPTPSFSSSRRVKWCIGSKSLDAFYGAMVGRASRSRLAGLQGNWLIDIRVHPWDSGNLIRQPAHISGTHYLAPGNCVTTRFS